MRSGSRKISERLFAAPLLLLLASPAHAAECYADRTALKSAVRTIVASFKCPGFKQALFGDAVTRFLSEAGIVDHSTGSCRSAIAGLIEAMSAEILSGEAAFCAKAMAELDASYSLRAAAAKAGAL
jgi:hypothetical protein